MSALIASVHALLPAVDPVPAIDFSGVQTLVQSMATAYAPAVLAIFGIGLGIAAVVWGFPKLFGLFKKSAK